MGKLADFNTARGCETTPLTPTGTSEFWAPEVLLGGSPSWPNDIYGVGLCLHLMLTGCLPKDRLKYSTRQELARQLLGYGEDFGNCPRLQTVSANCRGLVSSMLAGEIAERPSAAQVLQDQWFS